MVDFAAPLVSFDRCELPEVNRCLVEWGHEMGPLERPNEYFRGYALYQLGEPVAVVASSTLIRENVGGGLLHLTRANTVEVSRLCAARPGLCLVALRLWRETVFPHLGFPSAISYSDCKLHRGDVYRLDGWRRALGPSGKPLVLHSGTDARSGKRGRDKHVWVWPPAAREAPEGFAPPAPPRRPRREPAPDLFAEVVGG